MGGCRPRLLSGQLAGKLLVEDLADPHGQGLGRVTVLRRPLVGSLGEDYGHLDLRAFADTSASALVQSSSFGMPSSFWRRTKKRAVRAATVSKTGDCWASTDSAQYFRNRSRSVR
jgi:hypothetical protein